MADVKAADVDTTNVKNFPDYTPDNNQGRFNVLGGNPAMWWNSDTKTTLVVYFVPDSDPPLPIYWEVPDKSTVQSYFGPDVKSPQADRHVTNAQLVSYGALGQGSSLEIPATDQDPLLSWAEIYERQAEVRPYLRDPEVIGLMMGAAIEGRAVTQPELESTEWWQTHSEGEREWLIKAEADPVTAAITMESNQARVRDDLSKSGMADASDDLIQFLSTQYTTGLWTENMLISQVAAVTDPYSVHVMTAETRAFMDGIGAYDTTRQDEDTVRTLLTKWLGPTFGDWSQGDISSAAGRIRNDPDAEQEFIESLKDQRITLFSNYTDRNVSYESIMRPWKNYAENLWGAPADETDTALQQAMAYNDPKQAGDLLMKTGFDRGYDKVVQDVGDGIETGMRSNVRGVV